MKPSGGTARHLSLSGDSLWAYLGRASAYAKKGMYQLASQDCEAAISFDPASSSAYACRGDALYDLGDHERALADYGKAVDLNRITSGPTAAQQLAQYILNHARESIDQGRENIALAAYRDAVEVDPALMLSPEKEVILEKARVLIRTDNADGALVLFKDQWQNLSGLATGPEALFANTLVEVAKEDIDRQAYERALALYQQAARADPGLKLNPELETALAKGEALAVTGWEDEAALSAFDQAIRIASDRPSAYRGRAAVYQHMGKDDRALADLDRAIDLGLRNDSVYNARGQIHSQRGELAQALADYTQAMLSNPEAEYLLPNRANVYQRLGEWDKAIADYTSAIASSPDLAWLYYQRGDCFSANGQLDEAIRDFSKAIDLGNSVGTWPTLAVRYVGRAQAYVTQARYAEAIADISTAIRLDPENDYYRQLRGDAYYDQGDPERAVSDYSEAVKLAARSGGAGVVADNAVVIPLSAQARSTAQEAEAGGVAQYVFQTAERYASAGQYEKALEAYHRAHEMTPSASFVPEQKVAEARGTALAHEGKVADALVAYREAAALDPATGQTPEAALAAAIVADAQNQVLAGRYDQALETYRLAVKVDPGSGLVPAAEVALGRGRALVWQGKLEEALTLLEQAAALVPARKLVPRTEIGSILRQQAGIDVRNKQFERAIEHYRQAAEWDPDDAVAPELAVAQSLVSQAESDIATGSDEPALNAYRKAAEFAPAAKIVPEAELALQQAIKSVLAEHPEDAMMWLRQAVTLNPTLERDRAADIVWPYFEICQRSDSSHQSLDRTAICGQAASAAATTDSVDLNWAICRWGLAANLAAAVRPACSRTDALAQAIGYKVTRQVQMPLAGDMVWRFAAKALQSAQIAVSSMDDTSLTAAVYSPSGRMLGFAATGGKSVPATVQLDALPETGTYRIVVSRPSMPVSLPTAGVQRIAVTSPVSRTIAMPLGISTLRPTDFGSGEVTNYYLTLARMEEP